MTDGRLSPVDVARAAVEAALQQLGEHTEIQRATIGFFALMGAAAGNRDVRLLATDALAKALADPDILKRIDPYSR